MNDSTNNDDSILLGVAPKAATLGELLQLWNIQENLFQGYRRLLLAFEGVFISICSLILSHPIGNGSSDSQSAEIVLVVSFMCAGIFMYVRLEPIVKARGELVYFCQLMITKTERGEEIRLPFKEMKEYHNKLDSKWRRDPDYIDVMNERHKTRRSLSRGITIVISLGWAGIFFASVIRYSNYLWHYEIQNYFVPVMFVFSPFILVGLMIFSGKPES
jgi:hypothetical protein